MKKLLIIFLTIAVLLPLYAQQDDWARKDRSVFTRQYFAFGVDVGVGIANNFVGRKDIFTKDIVIDMNKIEESIGDEGIDLYSNLFAETFFSIKNIRIAGGKWDFDFSSGAEGSLNGNLPKNLVTLISKGNKNEDSFEGTISVRGTVFGDAGLGITAKFGRLRVGIRPALYTPLVHIPKSGINYNLDTSEGVSLMANGEVHIYSPFTENGELKFGYDLSVNGAYALFPFLDVGGSFSNIPIAPSRIQNRMRITMADIDNWGFTGQDLIDGKGLDDLNLDFNEEYDTHPIKVLRPLRFDAYLRLKPFSREIFVLTPNVGFTYDMNDKDRFLNAGLEARLNFIDLFVPYVASGLDEGLWKHRLGFILNLRAFELDLEASIQSHDFKESLQMKGFGVNLGFSFGW